MSVLFLYGIASLFGVRITSFYRTPEHNAEVGGVANSKHQFLQALDIGSETPTWFLKLIETMGFKLLDEQTHFHIENTPESEIFFSRSNRQSYISIQKELNVILTNNLTNKEVIV